MGREGQGPTGAGQRPSQHTAQLFGRGGGGGVCHLQGHVEGIGNDVCRAEPLVVLWSEASTAGQRPEHPCKGRFGRLACETPSPADS